jgi:hypothetical protein
MNPLSFLSANIWRAACIALAALLVLAIGIAGVQTLRIDGGPLMGRGLMAELAQARQDAKTQFDAHVQTIRQYRAAQVAAAAADRARLARVSTDQERISDDVSQDYTRRLADLRARYERLRSEAPAGTGSAASGQPVPGISAPAGGAAAPAGGDGFSLGRRLTASEQALQLDALIGWAERQHGIDPNR